MNILNLRYDFYFTILQYCNNWETEIIKNFAKYINKKLNKSAENGDLCSIKAIIKLGIIPTKIAMNYACIGGNLEVVRYFHSLGVSTSKCNLDLAIMYGHQSVVQFLS